MTFYNAPVESFLEKMSDKRFGIFLIIGKADSDKTGITKKYFGKIPDSVRKNIVSSSPELEFFGEYEKKNISCVKVATSSLVSEIVHKFIEMRSSAIGVDVSDLLLSGKTEREILETCAMASISANISITLDYDNLEDFHKHMQRTFSSPDADLTYAGFLKRVKGIAFLEKSSVLEGEAILAQCVEFDEVVKACVIREHSSENLFTSLEMLGRSQGYPTIPDQKNTNAQPEVPRATALAWKEFLNSEKNIAMITGGTGTGKTTLEISLARLAEEVGEKVLYCSGKKSIHEVMGQEGFAESTILVLDELHHSESVSNAMELAKDRKILFNCHAPNHYSAISRLQHFSSHAVNYHSAMRRLQLEENDASEAYLDIFNQQLGLVLLTYKDGFKRKSSPLIIEEKERNELEGIMKLGESTAMVLVSQMVSDQGFDS